MRWCLTWENVVLWFILPGAIGDCTGALVAAETHRMMHVVLRSGSRLAAELELMYQDDN
jgi:hypothetical protein